MINLHHARRYQDRREQARRDLKAARDSRRNENYEGACFQAQQATEKALKCLLRFHNQEPKGRTLIGLLEMVRSFAEIPDEMPSHARELDRHYIQPRYPNGFVSGYPGQYYDEITADRAIGFAQEILDFVAGHVH